MLHSKLSGSGPPITLLHGFTSHGGAWEGVRARLDKSHRVLTIDFPGHGKSPAPRSGYDFAACADDVVEAMERSNQTPGTLVGYSMGGRIALAAALRAPQAIQRLVLESTSPGIENSIEREARRTDDTTLAAEIESTPWASFVDRWMNLPLFRSQHRLGDDALAHSRAVRLDNDRAAVAASLRCLGTGSQPSYWKDLSKLSLPVLLVTGEEDAKFHAIADEMQRRIATSTRATVPAVGHTTHLEDPDGFLTALTTFLAATAKSVSTPRPGAA